MITYLKRRLSSGDLQGELADKRENEGLPSFLRFGGTSMFSGQSSSSQAQTGSQAYPTTMSQHQNQGYQSATGRSGVPGDAASHRSLFGSSGTGDESTGTAATRRGRTAYPSAPTSPHRSSSLGGSFMGSITGQISSTIMRGLSTAATTAQGITTTKSSSAKEKILFIIDDSQTDWCKYFKGKRLAGEWDIRVEQAQFSDISMTAYSNLGCVVNVYLGANRVKPSRSFRPDFILLRQHTTCEAGVDWQCVLTGLMYSRTPCMNTVHAVYNMKNRPWLFAHLLSLRNRLGKEAFPLISQTYHTDHRELVTAPSFPTVVKIGFGHKGEGKIRVDGPVLYQDVASLLATSNIYATNEPYVDAKCDIHVQKIGLSYKAFVRKSVSGNWKVNTGPVIIEKVAMNDKYKLWVDEVSKMFGGLDICSVEAVQSKTGEQFIYEVNGSDMDLFGESQEEDRRDIASLVFQRMSELSEQPKTVTKATSLHSVTHGVDMEISDKLREPAGTSVGLPVTYQQTNPPQQSQKLPPQHQVPSRYQQLTSAPAQHTPQTTVIRQSAPEPPSNSSYVATEMPGAGISPIQPITVSNFTQDHSPVPGALGSGSSYTSSTGSTSSSVFCTTPQRKAQAGYPGYADSPTPTYGSQATTSTSPFGNVFQSDHPRPGKSAVPSDWATNTFSSSWNSTDSSSRGVSTVTPSNNAGTGQFMGGYAGQTSVGGEESIGGTESQRSQSSLDYNDVNVTRFGGTGRQPSSTSNPAIIDQFKHGGDSTVWASSKAPPPSRPFVPPRQTSLKTGNGPEETDDTMKNLRKTFAGIFGDM